MAEQYLTKAGLAYFYSKLDLKAGSVDIRYGTVSEWNAQTDLISEKNVIYVYSDYQVVDGENIPAIKLGDGLAYLIDLPVIAGNSAIDIETAIGIVSSSDDGLMSSTMYTNSIEPLATAITQAEINALFSNITTA